jgi:hypothetical protein
MLRRRHQSAEHELKGKDHHDESPAVHPISSAKNADSARFPFCPAVVN